MQFMKIKFMNSKILMKTSISTLEVRIQSRCLIILSVFCVFVFVNSKICSSMNEIMNRLKKFNEVTSSEDNLNWKDWFFIWINRYVKEKDSIEFSISWINDLFLVFWSFWTVFDAVSDTKEISFSLAHILSWVDKWVCKVDEML